MNYRRKLIKYAHLIAAKQLVIGSQGNISLKTNKQILIKASGVHLKKAREQNFISVDICTLTYKHERCRPSCELLMHTLIYRQRPDIKAVIHTHPFYAMLLISCSIKPKILMPEFILQVSKNFAILPFICPGTKKLAQKVADVARKTNVIYLKNHGMVVLGENLEKAFFRTRVCEQMARMQIFSLLLDKKMIPITKYKLTRLIKS